MMNADRLTDKLTAAGCCTTSAGIIALDTQRLILSFIEALERIDALEGEISTLTPPPEET